MTKLTLTSLVLVISLSGLTVARAGFPDVKWEQKGDSWVAVVTHDLSGRSFKSLSLNKFNGSANVTGVDAGAHQLVIRCVMDRKLSRDEAESYLKKMLPSVKFSDNQVQVITPEHIWWGNREIYFTLNATVPVATDLELGLSGGDARISSLKGAVNCSSSGGDVEISNVEGSLSVATSGGDMIFEEIRGELSAATSGGDIRLENSSGNMEITTSGGDITIRRSDGTLTASTSGGDIVASGVKGDEVLLTSSGGNLDISDLSVTRRAELQSVGGDVELQHTSGSIDASTSSGDVKFSDHQGAAEIATNSGDVDLRDIQGGIIASASSGNISVRLTNGMTKSDRVELTTNSGRIELFIPSKIGAYLEASTTSGSQDEDWIDADFPLTFNRSRRSGMSATAEINGGGFPIQMSVGSGEINVRSK